MKALVGAFNEEKALVGAFSVIVKLRVIFENLRLKLAAHLSQAEGKADPSLQVQVPSEAESVPPSQPLLSLESAVRTACTAAGD